MMPKVKQVRTLNISDLHVRADPGGDDTPATNVVTGYAAVFDQPTSICDVYTETIAPGAFDKTLSTNNDIRALFNHDTGRVLGRSKAGTLQLQEDEHGLAFTLELPDTSTGRDLAVSMQRGDINQCSFGFYPTVEEWDYTDPDNPVDTVREVELIEISIVTFPAYEGTEAALARGKDSQQQLDSISLRKQVLKQIHEVKKYE